MKQRRISAWLALAAQAFFLCAMSFLPWGAAALASFGISCLALALALAPRPAAFPRLQAGNCATFASMSFLLLFFSGADLFPYTGVFFGACLGASYLAEAAIGGFKGKSMRSVPLPVFLKGCGYAASAALQLAFFPRPAYLYYGVGLLAAVSVADILGGILSSGARRRALAKASLSGAAFILLFSLAPTARAQEESAAPDDAMFTELFGEAPPNEAPQDMLRIREIAVERPAGFTDAYILSYARNIKAGDRLTRRELEKALARSGERMELSGMFYQSSAGYTALESTPGDDGALDVRVTLRVSDGFWWGFNFSPWDVSVGYKNLFGEGKQISGAAGLNTQGLSFSDPAVGNGKIYYSLGAEHNISQAGGGADRMYLGEGLEAKGEIGVHPMDDLSAGVIAGYRTARALESYFLYPGFDAPEEAELSALGVSYAFSPIGLAGAELSFGYYSYKRRGGIEGRASAGAMAYLPLAAGISPAYAFSFSGDLRYDAPALLRLTLHEGLEYFPSPLPGSGLPETLWARAEGFRSPLDVDSGEFGSLSRASLSLDPAASFNLGFTTLSLIPELFYEAALIARSSASARPTLSQDCGFLLKADFSAPVGRAFAFGLALSLPAGPAPTLTFVFEIE